MKKPSQQPLKKRRTDEWAQENMEGMTAGEQVFEAALHAYFFTAGEYEREWAENTSQPARWFIRRTSVHQVYTALPAVVRQGFETYARQQEEGGQ